MKDGFGLVATVKFNLYIITDLCCIEFSGCSMADIFMGILVNNMSEFTKPQGQLNGNKYAIKRYHNSLTRLTLTSKFKYILTYEL